MIPSQHISLPTIDSTNRHAKSLILESSSEAIDGLVISTEEQTAGKGRLGRAWQAAKGANLTFSVILRPANPVVKFGLIPLLAAVAVTDALETLSINAETKWPNDILLRGKKVCGILCEMVTDPTTRQPVVVMGIGLNVNQTEFPPDIAATATSLAMYASAPFDREKVLATVLESLDRWYGVYVREEYAAIRLRWKQSCPMLGNEVTLLSGGERIHGTALDISEEGALILHTGEKTEQFYAGDVTIAK